MVTLWMVLALGLVGCEDGDSDTTGEAGTSASLEWEEVSLSCQDFGSGALAEHLVDVEPFMYQIDSCNSGICVPAEESGYEASPGRLRAQCPGTQHEMRFRWIDPR